jgi:hypothetical protein
VSDVHEPPSVPPLDVLVEWIDATTGRLLGVAAAFGERDDLSARRRTRVQRQAGDGLSRDLLASAASARAKRP